MVTVWYVLIIIEISVFQVFSKEFTNTYLLKFLRPVLCSRAPRHGVPKGSEVILLAVNKPTVSKTQYCRMMLTESGQAVICFGWKDVVKTFSLKEGDVCLFSFRDTRIIPVKIRDPAAWLQLVIIKLD